MVGKFALFAELIGTVRRWVGVASGTWQKTVIQTVLAVEGGEFSGDGGMGALDTVKVKHLAQFIHAGKIVHLEITSGVSDKDQTARSLDYTEEEMEIVTANPHYEVRFWLVEKYYELKNKLFVENR